MTGYSTQVTLHFDNQPMERLEEITALEDGSALEAADAAQRFHALEFPAHHGSAVMKYLTRHFGALPALGFGHLKRMKKLKDGASHWLVAIIVPVEEDEAVLPSAVQDKAAEMEQLFSGRLSVVEALRSPPRTRELWETHTKQWPLVFHASVLPETQAPPPITGDEVEQMERHVRAAVRCAAPLESLPCAHGCVIVDPEVDELVATSTASSDRHAFQPIWHPVMVAIDAVAVRDHERDQQSAKKPRREEARSPSDEDDEVIRESYLCTGYDVYMDREPCAMCAMALVHSRARRVVFGSLNLADGALAGRVRLHTLKSLNHHYRAFHLAVGDGDDSTE